MNNTTGATADKAPTIKLSSLKSPRDLTLGGCGAIRSKTTKKVYTPNLNIVRQKAAEVKTSKDTIRKVRNKVDKNKSERGGHRNRSGNNHLIQTLGVFSEGFGGTFKRSSSGYSSGNIGGSRKNDDIKPRKSIQLNGKIDPKSEQRYLDDILGDSASDDDCEIISCENQPVKLIKENVALEKLDSLKIQEDLDKNKICDIKQLFDSQASQLFLIQFPDALPCEKIDSKIENNQDNENSSVQQPSISMLPEGQIGKLIRYRSGKQKMVLGNFSFDLNLGMESKFVQQLVSIITRPEERSGDMINLGKISTKVTVTPDWDSLTDES